MSNINQPLNINYLINKREYTQNIFLKLNFIYYTIYLRCFMTPLRSRASWDVGEREIYINFYGISDGWDWISSPLSYHVHNRKRGQPNNQVCYINHHTCCLGTRRYIPQKYPSNNSNNNLSLYYNSFKFIAQCLKHISMKSICQPFNKNVIVLMSQNKYKTIYIC